jgi:Zn-finger nucleic acid-binding protein
MPYLICPKCRLTVYSAAIYATADRCPGCDGALERGAERAPLFPRLTPSTVGPAPHATEASHGTR